MIPRVTEFMQMEPSTSQKEAKPLCAVCKEQESK